MPLVLPFPNIDPAIFSVELFGLTLSLRWYALAYLAALILGWRLVVALVRRPQLWPGDKAPITAEQAEQLLTWMVLGVILGGRLGFVIFYQPAYYIAHPAEILQVWNGGMAFHGGLLGVMAAIVIWARVSRVPLLQLSDAIALATPTGLLFGRLANFINAELWGRETDMPWAMVFPGAGDLPRHPSQLYEAALEGVLLLALLWILALRFHWLKRPGMIAGLFFIGYGAARAFVENFRNADPQYVSPENPAGHVIRLSAEIGFTMGQTLSLPMIAFGIGLWVVARRA